MKKTMLVVLITMFTFLGKAYAEMSYGVLDTGIDRGNYPSPRTVSVGLNVKF